MSLSDGQAMLNALLLESGLAQVSTWPPNVKYVELFTELQKAARNKGVGMWKLDENINPQAVKLVELRTPVAQQGRARISIQGAPNTEYAIIVTYKTGNSRAAGLVPKVSNTQGFVSWEWNVGPNTTPGKWPITVTHNGVIVLKTNFEVVK